MTYKYRRMCEVYKIFSWKDCCDFSDESMQEMFDFESYGKGSINISGFNTTGKKSNGFAVGKKWLNVTVDMWFEECSKHGWRNVIERLYADPEYPHWWLDEVFKDYLKNKEEFYKSKNIHFPSFQESNLF